MSQEPLWLTKEDALAYHFESIVKFGGSHGVRDEGLLESALARPQNKWAYEQSDIPTLAAAYAYGISSNHPFVDGNKRTAFVCCRVFLVWNNYDFTASPEEATIAFLELAAGKINEEALTRWVKDRSQPRNP